MFYLFTHKTFNICEQFPIDFQENVSVFDQFNCPGLWFKNDKKYHFKTKSSFFTTSKLKKKNLEDLDTSTQSFSEKKTIRLFFHQNKCVFLEFLIPPIEIFIIFHCD